MFNRILIIAEYGILNGGEQSLLAVLPYLRNLDWQFEVLLPIDSEFSQALISIGVKTWPLARRHPSGSNLSQAELRLGLSDTIQSIRPDLIHCNSLATSRWCGPIVNRIGVPAVGYLRDIIKLSAQAVEDINRLDRIIAVSQATCDWHVGQGMDSKKISVIHNGVDLEKFAPRPAALNKLEATGLRAELKLNASDPRLLFVGQIGIRKGVDLVLAAFEKIAHANANCQLLIVGERNSTKQEAIDFESNLLRVSRESPFSNRIHWLGRRTDVAELMRQSTILLHPARQEPLGRVLLEAAACGLPMVTSHVGGSPEVLAGLESFSLLQPLDGDAIAKRVLELLANESQRAEIGRQFRFIAESRFSDRQCAMAIDHVYRQLSQGKPYRKSDR